MMREVPLLSWTKQYTYRKQKQLLAEDPITQFYKELNKLLKKLPLEEKMITTS